MLNDRLSLIAIMQLHKVVRLGQISNDSVSQNRLSSHVHSVNVTSEYITASQQKVEAHVLLFLLKEMTSLCAIKVHKFLYVKSYMSCFRIPSVASFKNILLENLTDFMLLSCMVAKFIKLDS